MPRKDKMPTAHSLEDAVNADNSLEGYAAMNAGDHDEIAKIAYRLYEERGREHGHHEDDWYRAEHEYRSHGAGRGASSRAA